MIICNVMLITLDLYIPDGLTLLSWFVYRLIHIHVHHQVKTRGPANTKHLYNICTMLVQRQRRWADVVQMLYDFLCLLGGGGGYKVDHQRGTWWNGVRRFAMSLPAVQFRTPLGAYFFLRNIMFLPSHFGDIVSMLCPCAKHFIRKCFTW